MEYTILQLAKLSGVSTRTLRYYDEIDLLKPARTNEAGYRFYGQQEVDILQQILFYKALDMKLETIHNIIHAPDFQHKAALKTHRDACYLTTKKTALGRSIIQKQWQQTIQSS
ncbi:MerR family transcriptional regulator OS=Lysinibacillus sphaericus OX=1421 GN=LS41612_05820 PE=4 SV=1 [Lysinibacillus sphaericus]